MKDKKREFDLKDAFAAPPESYVRRTRATLDSLEEADSVKKVAWGSALAIACALVIMTTAFAAGLNNLRMRDNIAGQQLSNGNTPAASTGAARDVDNDVTISVDDAQFDGEYLYLYFELRGNEAYQKRALDVENGYEVSVSVNGREVSPMVGSIVAEGAGVTRCAGVYKCDAAQTADVLIDVSNDKIGATFAKRVQTGTSIQRCRVYQSADGGMPEPIESFGLMGDHFKMVQVKYAAGSNLGDASLEVARDNSVMSQYTDENGACTIGILLRDVDSPDITFRLFDSDTNAASKSVTLTLAPMTEAVMVPDTITYNSEGQFDGKILHLRIETNDAADMDVTVNGQTPEVLGGVATIQHASGNDAISYVYDMVYRCAQAEQADVRVTTHAETGAGFSMQVNVSNGMKMYGLDWLGANEPDGFNGYAINGSGFGMAVLNWPADDAQALGMGMDYSLNVNNVQANISDYYLDESAQNRMVVYLAGESLPDEFTLAGNEGYDDVALKMAEIDSATVIGQIGTGNDGELASNGTGSEAMAVSANVQDFDEPVVELEQVAQTGDSIILSISVSTPGQEVYSAVSGEDEGTAYAQPAPPADAILIEGIELKAGDEALKCVSLASTRPNEDDRSRLVLTAAYRAAQNASDAYNVTVECGGTNYEFSFTAENAGFAGGSVESVYDGRYLLVSYWQPVNDSIAGAEQTDGEITLETIAQDNKLEPVWSLEKTADDGKNLVFVRLYEYSAGDSADFNLCLNMDGKQYEEQFIVHSNSSAIHELNVECDTPDATVRAFEIGGEMLLAVEYDCADSANPIVLYSGESGVSENDVLSGDDGVPKTVRLNVLYDSVPDDGNIKLYSADGAEAMQICVKYANGLNVEKAYRVGDYIYALASVEPEGGNTARWSGEVDRVTDEISALTDITDEQERGARLYELTRKYNDAMKSLTEPEAASIGGADGPIDVYIKESAGSTPEIGTGDSSADDADDGNADTANSAESVITVGGADGPTDIYIASFGDISLVRQPRLFVNGEDVTLCVADVSGIVECPEGTLMLALVCRAGETDGASLHVTIDNNGFWTELNAENWLGGELEDWMNAVNPDAAGAEISVD